MPLCPSCGSQVGVEQNFCRECGSDVSDLGAATGSPQCPNCSAAISAEQNFCRECGHDISDVQITGTGSAPQCPSCGSTVSTDQQFCRECGQDLTEQQPEGGGPQHTTNSSYIAEEHGAYVTDARVAKIVDVLDDDEKVHYLTRGGTIDVEGSSAGTSLFGDDRSRKSGTKGYVRTGITDRRVVVKIPQWLGDDERTIPYRNITSVDLDTGWVTKRISLQTAGQTYHIEATEPDKPEVREAVKFIREKLAESQTETVVQAADEPDPTEQLKNIKELHEQGVLSDEEFETKKQDLLEKI